MLKNNSTHCVGHKHDNHARRTTPNVVNVHFTLTLSTWYVHNKIRLRIGFVQETLRVRNSNTWIDVHVRINECTTHYN